MAKKRSYFQQAKEYGGGIPLKFGSGLSTGYTLFELGIFQYLLNTRRQF